ncbi:MAG: hypothetical protein LIP23_03490, partial [Planctomycetes bacterium]|nr:hypothetical protein [Planctomycetota bacterium]
MRIVKIAAAIAVSLPLIGVMGCCEQNPCNTGCDYVASAAPCDCTTFPTQGRTWTPRTQPGLNGVAIRPASVEYEVEPMYYRLGADVSANSSAVRMGTVPGRRIARRSESQPKYITPFATRRRGVVETTDFAPAVAVVPATPAAQAVAVAPVTVGSAVPAIPVAAIPVQSAAGGVCAPGDNLSECFTLPETAAASGDLELVVPTADVAMAASSSAAAAPTEELVIPDVPVIDAPIASRQELETASTLEAPITVSDLAEPTTLPPAIDASQVQTSRQLAEVVPDPEPLAPPAELLTDAAD